MLHLAEQDLTGLLAHYGYLAVVVLIAVESMGIPLPGETMLITAAIYAGSTHRLNIGLVILAAVAGAVLGDNLGYFIGREGGFRLLRRYGHRVGITDARLRLGQYLFRSYGAQVVFFGRFVAILRALAAVPPSAGSWWSWRWPGLSVSWSSCGVTRSVSKPRRTGLSGSSA